MEDHTQNFNSIIDQIDHFLLNQSYPLFQKISSERQKFGMENDQDKHQNQMFSHNPFGQNKPEIWMGIDQAQNQQQTLIQEQENSKQKIQVLKSFESNTQTNFSQNIVITPEDLRRCQTQSIDMFDQIPTKFFRTHPNQIFSDFLAKYKKSYKSKFYILLAFALIYQNSSSFFESFRSSFEAQIKEIKNKIEKRNYTTGLKFLLKQEMNNVSQAFVVFFQGKFKEAVQLIYLKQEKIEFVREKTRKGFINACKILKNQFNFNL